MRHINLIREQKALTQKDIIGLDVEVIRKDFPILQTKVRGKPLIYFDNAATTQKPRVVIDNISNYYLSYNSNIHRGVHYLSQYATREYETSRKKIQKFINAKHSEEIIFTRGTTESINLIASTFGRANIQKNDEIIITEMEHHSNIVPWQMLCLEKDAKLRIVPIDDDGNLIVEEYKKLFNAHTRLVSLVHISNSLGTVNPVEEMIQISHSFGVPVILDGAQSIQHTKIDVQKLDCDFFAFSGHKIYGPTGIGVLYGKKEYLDTMPPYQGGGDMIKSVSFEKTIFNDLPHKFEAGTPNIIGAIGLGEAINYIQSIGLDAISKYESELLDYATQSLSSLEKVRIIGTARKKAAAISFIINDIHPHDIGTMLDMYGIAIRTGHHCTEPVMRRYSIPATSRVSFAFYNTKSEIDIFIEALYDVIKMFR